MGTDENKYRSESQPNKTSNVLINVFLMHTRRSKGEF